ncbi:HAMP domain-containing sensor histidine kinase [Paenibacillus oryzisoli]|uniref:sensor histidine kinase n=1 Tax=Paenibacillus oryzisoli TaxID=1850517 RepID=UPI003D2DF8D8
MFTKLRNRFLILNLVIISVMMLAAFAAIYTITYGNVHRDIQMELGKVSDFLHSPDGGGGQGKPHRGGDKGGPPMFDDGMGPPAERSVSFSLQTDVHWAITSTNSRFDMDEDFYTNAIAKVSSGSANGGQFTLDGNRWAYKVDLTPNGYSVVFLDVTAQVKILTTLVYTFLIVGLVMLVVIYFTSRFFANRSIAPVREAFNRQKQFIADASHELKTPLAVINTNADVLLANSEDTIAQQAKWLHHIKSETERMKTLTNDLLYLTEMDDARMQMIVTPVNLSDAVEGVLLAMEAVSFEKDIALSYDIEPELTVRGSSEQLGQVVMILLDNAIKYTNPKGSIALSLRKRHNDALLTVTNTGPGIAPEHLERIFDRFYRADPSRSRKMGGYGLGLAIAKSIVEQHSGRIAAKSVVDESTTFTVQLPLGA